ncbi:MAG: molybdopterin-dependent oxidoreductase [Leptolinea sp.]|jgi:formate dehydrogenase major subunit|nr:molybdopterin-dependent oxidoreductase [Leptolinea sp.]
MVNLTIDGKNIEVKEGTTVLRAAQAAGIEIPTLCDHSELTPYGGCRLCLVEVEGARTLQPSCTLPVSEKMVVKTTTDRVKEARKFVLTLLFSERNHFCPFCQESGGDCELQNAAYAEGMTNWPLSPNFSAFGVDASSPYFVLDNNRCILCRRCVRACGDLVGNFTLGFEERGAKSYLVADYGIPLGESSCVSCGTCVQICPTGALIDRQSAYRGKDSQVTKVASICTGCSVGCAIDVNVKDNQLVRIEGRWSEGVSSGILCKTGRFLPLEEKRERILTPMVRKNGSLKAATLDEAITALSVALKPLAGKNGNGVAALASTRLSIESLSLFKQIFSDGMKCSMVTTSEEGWPTTAAASLADDLRKPFEAKMEVLDLADCVVVLDADLANNHQVLGFMVKRLLPGGTKLIVIDPEENGFDPFAEVKIKAAKGTRLDTLKALKAAIKKEKSTDLAAACGLKEADLQSAADILTSAEHPVFIYGRALSAKDGKAAVAALLDLASSVKNGSVISTRGKANSLAASQLKLDQPFEAGKHQAFFIALGDEEPSERLLKNLDGVPFLGVAAAYHSKLTAKADVVIPVEMWAEVSGHYLNLDGRIQESVSALKAPAGVLSSVEAFKKIAAGLGIKTTDAWKETVKSRVSPTNIVEA